MKIIFRCIPYLVKISFNTVLSFVSDNKKNLKIINFEIFSPVKTNFFSPIICAIYLIGLDFIRDLYSLSIRSYETL